MCFEVLGGALVRTRSFFSSVGVDVLLRYSTSNDIVSQGLASKLNIAVDCGADDVGRAFELAVSLIGPAIAQELTRTSLTTPPRSGVKYHVGSAAWAAKIPQGYRLVFATFNYYKYQLPNGALKIASGGTSIIITAVPSGNKTVIRGSTSTTTPALFGEALTSKNALVLRYRVGVVKLVYGGIPSQTLSADLLRGAVGLPSNASFPIAVQLRDGAFIFAGPPAGHLRLRDYVIIVGEGAYEHAEAIRRRVLDIVKLKGINVNIETAFLNPNA
jgi:hypothetical protein